MLLKERTLKQLLLKFPENISFRSIALTKPHSKLVDVCLGSRKKNKKNTSIRRTCRWKRSPSGSDFVYNLSHRWLSKVFRDVSLMLGRHTELQPLTCTSLFPSFCSERKCFMIFSFKLTIMNFNIMSP